MLYLCKASARLLHKLNPSSPKGLMNYWFSNFNIEVVSLSLPSDIAFCTCGWIVKALTIRMVQTSSLTRLSLSTDDSISSLVLGYMSAIYFLLYACYHPQVRMWIWRHLWQGKLGWDTGAWLWGQIQVKLTLSYIALMVWSRRSTDAKSDEPISSVI